MAETDLTYRTPYDAIGGEAGLRTLVDAFYDRMEQDPEVASLRAMHDADLAPMRERLTDWLSGWMGGPAVYGERHPGRPCIMSAHGGLGIRQDHAVQWMDCMRAALAQTELDSHWSPLVEEAFARMCAAFATAAG
jgi:hemoglobin